MDFYVQAAFWIVGLALQFVVLSALISGSVRRFPAVFVYTLFLFITTIVEIFATMDRGSLPPRLWSQIFWFCDLTRQAGLYAVVISLVARSVPQKDRAAAIRNVLILLAIVFWAGSFYFHWHPRMSVWMTGVTRNLSFCLAVVNLGLWLVLIASERRDPVVLTITGGLGIQMTGEAIAQSVRQLSPSTVMIGNVLAVLAHFLCLFIWWQALRTSRSGRTPSPSAAAASR